MAMTNAEKRAAELHKEAIIIDCHSDILMAITDGKARLGEKVEVPDPQTWIPPRGIKGHASPNLSGYSPHQYYYGTTSQYDLPIFQEGGVTAEVCAIYLEDHDLERALERGMEMTWWFHKEVEDNPNFGMVTTAADIRRFKREGKIGGILGFEGFEPLGFELRFLDLYHKLGLRMASLTHCRRNFFGDGDQRDVKQGGLTALGKQAVKRMNELGIVIDLVHLNQVGFWEVMNLTTDPAVYSHAPTRLFFPRDGKPNDRYPGFDISRGRERLEAIAKNGGVVGVMFYKAIDLDDIVADFEYIMEMIGPDHVGLGSDLYGVEWAPKGLENLSKLPALTKRLVERGHSDEVILKVLGGNYLRVFERVWGG